ncbi:MAG: hypothetical protein HY318_08615 [Armatimonadetes bacterium]|nr:hypothetical protein [Armatimonadota bacterium]
MNQAVADNTIREKERRQGEEKRHRVGCVVGDVHQSAGSNMDDRGDQTLGERKDVAVHQPSASR